MAEKSKQEQAQEDINDWINGTGRIVLPLVLVIIVVGFIVTAIFK